jgi:photosystem II stability/assembly factor-like uncharacterized protein
MHQEMKRADDRAWLGKVLESGDGGQCWTAKKNLTESNPYLNRDSITAPSEVLTLPEQSPCFGGHTYWYNAM